MTRAFKTPEEADLTPQQFRYVQEYLIDPTSQKAAAIRAGYAIPTSQETSSRLMSHPKVKEAIRRGQLDLSEKMGITAQRVLQELALIGFAKINDSVSVGPDGEAEVDLKGLSQGNPNSPTEVTVSITKGRHAGKTTTIKSVKHADKVSALEKIGKHLGMFKEQVEHSGTVTLEQLVANSMKQELVVEPTITEEPVTE